MQSDSIYTCSICRRKFIGDLDPCPYCSAPKWPQESLGTGDWKHYCQSMLGHVMITPHLAPCLACGKRQEEFEELR